MPEQIITHQSAYRTTKPVRLTTGLVDPDLDPDQGRPAYRARFARAGIVRAAGGGESNIEISPEALQSALKHGHFSNKAIFVDHAGWFDYPSLERLAGQTRNPTWLGGQDSLDTKTGHFKVESSSLNSLTYINCS